MLRFHWWIFLAAISVFGSSLSYIIGDRSLDVVYKDLGDLNVGGLFSVSAYDPEVLCGRRTSKSYLNVLQIMEILVYTVRKVNMDAKLLPGIKLGFVFLDFCSNVQVAMVQAKRFLPRSNPRDYTPTNNSKYLTSYKVVGVLGASVDYVTVPISVLYGGAGIPILGYSDSSDELSLKRQHPTFLRISSSRYVIIDAMLNFLLVNRWTYFMAVVQNNKEVEMLLSYLRLEAERYDMCMSTAEKVTETSDFDHILDNLLNDTAKVVLAFTSADTADSLLSHLDSMRAQGQMIWLLTDTWLPLMQSRRLTFGAFVFSSSSLDLPGFRFSVESLKLSPWFTLYRKFKNCQDEGCVFRLLSSDGKVLNKGDIHDALMIYAHGLRDLIRDKCPAARGSKAASCFESHSREFMRYLLNVSYGGISGRVFFDSKNDKLLNINVYQERKVDNFSEVVRIAKFNATERTYYDMIAPDLTGTEFPIAEAFKETRCQIPCTPDAYKTWSGCCWVCKRCRKNERVVQDGTACQKCPALHWPALQEGQLSICDEMKPLELGLFYPPYVVIILVDVAGVVFNLYILAMTIAGWSESANEAALPLTFPQLLAVFFGLMSVPCFLLRPSSVNCNAAHFLMVVSFSVEYVVLLLRCLQVYRNCEVIDDEGLRLTSAHNQTIFVLLVSALEIGAFSFLYIRYPIRPGRQRAADVENQVELYCDVPVPHVMCFLLFSMLFLLLCSVLSLKSQNDLVAMDDGRSHFVSTFVVISMVMWIAFMPAYFTAARRRMQMYLWVISSLVNHLGSLLLNFIPSILICTRNRDASIISELNQARKSWRWSNSARSQSLPAKTASEASAPKGSLPRNILPWVSQPRDSLPRGSSKV
ncbi:hypothetical protein Btru_052740 [Bulinus truncatus]|nr:hypothetical protein Btru_052740 [Bulinus truncatus]